ncbi:MAG TPA: hypothetical protein VFG10_08170 [Saprospiraceae bacterium]|nr:hypothetical protein [Saprospiraceae bacterium]
MKPSTKKYIRVFLFTGLIFSLFNLGIDYSGDLMVNLMRFSFNMCLYGGLGVLVYFIIIVLPKKNRTLRK